MGVQTLGLFRKSLNTFLRIRLCGGLSVWTRAVTQYCYDIYVDDVYHFLWLFVSSIQCSECVSGMKDFCLFRVSACVWHRGPVCWSQHLNIGMITCLLYMHNRPMSTRSSVKKGGLLNAMKKRQISYTIYTVIRYINIPYNIVCMCVVLSAMGLMCVCVFHCVGGTTESLKPVQLKGL